MTPTDKLSELLAAATRGPWEFDAPYALINRSPWFVLTAHGVNVASFNVDVWKSEQGCIEAAWHCAYGPKETETDIIARLEVEIEDHRADLIQRGLAEYCATDGRFAFKGECGK